MDHIILVCDSSDLYPENKIAQLPADLKRALSDPILIKHYNGAFLVPRPLDIGTLAKGIDLGHLTLIQPLFDACYC